jgi:hypothetical protein
VVDENGKELYRYLNPERDQDIRDILLFRNCFTHSTVMFRRETAIASGGYSEDESVKHLEDYDLWLKMGTRGTFYNLPSYSIRFLLSPSSISGKHKVEQMRKAVVLAWKNKDIYPQACSNIAKSAVRYCIVSAASLLGLGRVLSVFSGAYKRTR